MKFNIRWIVIGLALLCLVEVWSKPTDKYDDDSEFQDDAENGEANDEADKDGEDSEDDSQNLPVIPQVGSKTFVLEPGSNVKMPCEFTNSDKFMVSWKKNSEMLFAGDAKIQLDPRLELLKNYTLVINNVTLQDSSEYVCEIFVDQDKQPQIKHQLKVESKESHPLVRVLPSEYVEVIQGTSLRLGCEYLGKDNPIGIFWSRQGHRIKIDKQTSQGIYLQINNATRHLAGDYQCLIEIGTAKPLIQHLKLRVKHKPEIEYDKEYENEKMRERKHYYTGIGVDVNISCIVHAHPPVEKLHWLKDGQKLKMDGRLSKSDSRKSHHVLTIRNTLESDLGDYQCRAWNAMGETTGPVIHLDDTPDQPIFKEGKGVDDSIVFLWRVISYKPIVEAQLLYRKDGKDEWLEAKEVKVISDIGKEHIIQSRITGIEAGNHEAMLRARNDEKWGLYSEVKKFDGEYKDDIPAESVRDSATRSTFSVMTLLIIVLPLASWEL